MTTNKQTLNLSNETFERQSITIRRKKQQTPKQAAYNFFLKHGACSYEPAKETKQQGYARMARLLAKAERDACALGYTFEWEDDWTVGDHHKEYGECYKDGGPSTCEWCTMKDPNGKVVQSLGCIDDATRDYRRVVEAELALEELS
jgi:hypothetical protein